MKEIITGIILFCVGWLIGGAQQSEYIKAQIDGGEKIIQFQGAYYKLQNINPK